MSGKAGRMATCKHALGANRHQQAWVKRGFIFPWQKQDEQCRPQTSREGQPSQPLQLSKRLSGVGLELEGLSTEPEAQAEVSWGYKFHSLVAGTHFFPVGVSSCEGAPPLQEGRRAAFRVKVLLISTSSKSTYEVASWLKVGCAAPSLPRRAILSPGFVFTHQQL